MKIKLLIFFILCNQYKSLAKDCATYKTLVNLNYKIIQTNETISEMDYFGYSKNDKSTDSSLRIEIHSKIIGKYDIIFSQYLKENGAIGSKMEIIKEKSIYIQNEDTTNIPESLTGLSIFGSFKNCIYKFDSISQSQNSKIRVDSNIMRNLIETLSRSDFSLGFAVENAVLGDTFNVVNNTIEHFPNLGIYKLLNNHNYKLTNSKDSIDFYTDNFHLSLPQEINYNEKVTITGKGYTTFGYSKIEKDIINQSTYKELDLLKYQENYIHKMKYKTTIKIFNNVIAK
jgi:hypothetical protein